MPALPLFETVDRLVAKHWRGRRQSDWNVGAWLVLSGIVEGELWRVMTSWCRTRLTGGINGKSSRAGEQSVGMCESSSDSCSRTARWAHIGWDANKWPWLDLGFSSVFLFHCGISGSAEVKGVENVLRVCKDTLQSSRVSNFEVIWIITCKKKISAGIIQSKCARHETERSCRQM